MPIYKGKQIPFDPLAIAKLMYEGEQVFPDPDTPPEAYGTENFQVMRELRKLWGDKPSRVIEDVKHHERNPVPLFHVPGADTVINEFKTNMPFRRVIPNPFLSNSEMPTQDEKKLKGLLDL